MQYIHCYAITIYLRAVRELVRGIRAGRRCDRCSKVQNTAQYSDSDASSRMNGKNKKISHSNMKRKKKG